MSHSSPGRAARSPVALAALIAALTFVLFLPALRCGFVIWDDDQMVRDNVRIRSLGSGFFTWAFSDRSYGMWQPGAWLSHAVDYRVWGLNPAGHHLSGIMLHAANTFLVVLFVFVLLRTTARCMREGPLPEPVREGRDYLVATVAGVLFGLHPLHVEPAVWITGRTDLISAFFSLSCLLSYLSFAETARRDEEPWRFVLRGSYVLAFFCFCLALTAKPASVTLPAVLLILDWYPLGRFRAGGNRTRLLLEKLPFLAVTAAVVVLNLPHRGGAGDIAAGSISAAAPVTLALEAMALYLRKLVVPLGLLPVYPVPDAAGLMSFRVLVSGSLLLGVTTACLFWARKRPFFAAAWLSFFLLLLPTLAAAGVRNSFAADRYLYLPSVSLFLAVGLGVSQALDKCLLLPLPRNTVRMLFAAGLLSAGALLAILSVRQIEVWRTSVSLWSRVIEQEPLRVPIAYNNRGLAYREAGRPDLALDDYTTALSLGPGAKPFTNRGIVLAENGRPDAALADFDQAIRLDPDYADAYTSRGLLFARNGKIDDAFRDLDRAIALKPDSVDAWLNRATAFERKGMPERAIADYDRAAELNPEDGQVYFDRGSCYRKTGNETLARNDFAKACGLGYQEGCNR